MDSAHMPPSENPEAPPSEALFCSSVPQLPKYFDTVMLGLLKECPRKFKYIVIDGYQPNGFAAHLAFGIAYHKALETYDRDIAMGAGRAQALDAAVHFCLSYGSRTPEGHFLPYDAAFTREPSKTRDTLLRAVIWYLETFKNDPAKTFVLANGAAAVEHPFKIQLPDCPTPDGDPFVLCGHLDKLVELDGDLFPLDRKTSKSALNARFFNQFTPNNQMSLYYTAAQLVAHKPCRGIIIDAAELGVNYVRFKRHIIHRTAGQQEEWLKDTYTWLSLATQFATDEHWPMNDKSCGNFGGCAFQSICSRDAKVRQSFMDHEGYHRKHWNPLSRTL